MSTSNSVCSLSDEMATGALMVDRNLPELLVRDLDASEAIFTSLDMTAGCPCAGLAAPDFGAGLSSQRQRLPHRASYPQQHPTSHSHQRVVVKDGQRLRTMPSAHGRQLGAKSRAPDSSSDTSGCVEPLAIRTRQQSVATAATSLSGSDSLLSSSGPSPTSPILSPCSSNRDSSPHGTWFEAEPESPLDEASSSVYTERTSISDPPRTTRHSAGHDEDNDGDMNATQKPAATGGPDAQSTHAVYRADSCYSSDSRPLTPASQKHLEKPRIVTIHPAPAGSKRVSSTNKSTIGADSASMTSDPQEVLAAIPPTIGRHRQSGLCGGLQGESGMHLLETANGRTVIDASGSASVEPPGEEQPVQQVYAGPKPPVASRESKNLGNEDGLISKTRADLPTESRNPSVADFRRWAGRSAETLALSQISASSSPKAPAPGVPLPPEVIESLRVSISCFPETMLLTSSLSIETIRAYSRKVKHRADLDRQSRNIIYEPCQATSSQNAKPARRWHMSWLGHARRSSKNQQTYQPQQLPPPQHYHQHHTLFRTAHSARPDMSTLHLPSGPPLASAWAPIRNIFPSASDYLCDALYAHLLAYNYINSLCPMPFPARMPIPPRTSYHPGPSPDDPARNSLWVPQKAATLLGMDNPAPPPPHHFLRHQQQPQQQQHSGGGSTNAKGRSVLSRRSGGAGATTTNGSSHTLQDLFHLARTGTRGGGGGGGMASSHHHEGPGAASGAGSAMMRELQAGLGRCVGLLVATMAATAAATSWSSAYPGGGRRGVGGCAEEGSTASLVAGLGERGTVNGEGFGGYEAVLVRALCEVVRCAEEGSLCVL